MKVGCFQRQRRQTWIKVNSLASGSCGAASAVILRTQRQHGGGGLFPSCEATGSVDSLGRDNSKSAGKTSLMFEQTLTWSKHSALCKNLLNSETAEFWCSGMKRRWGLCCHHEAKSCTAAANLFHTRQLIVLVFSCIKQLCYFLFNSF